MNSWHETASMLKLELGIIKKHFDTKIEKKKTFV